MEDKKIQTEQRVKGRQVSMYIDPNLWRQAQHEAIDKGTSASQIVEEALRKHLGIQHS
jgi:hypothetical protein